MAAHTLEDLPEYEARLLLTRFVENPIRGMAYMRAVLVDLNGSPATDATLTPIVTSVNSHDITAESVAALRSSFQKLDWSHSHYLDIDQATTIVNKLVTSPDVTHQWMLDNLRFINGSVMTDDSLKACFGHELTRVIACPNVMNIDTMAGCIRHFMIMSR